MQQKGLFNHSSARHGLHRPTVIRLKLKLPSGCFSAANTEKDVPDLSVLMSPTWYFNIVVRQPALGYGFPRKSTRGRRCPGVLSSLPSGWVLGPPGHEQIQIRLASAK